VVLTDDLRDGTGEVHPLQDLRPDSGMLLHQEVLDLRQPSGLAQDLRGHRDLPHVVGQGGEPDRAAALLAVAQPERRRLRQRRRPALVSRRVGIPLLHHPREEAHHPVQDPRQAPPLLLQAVPPLQGLEGPADHPREDPEQVQVVRAPAVDPVHVVEAQVAPQPPGDPEGDHQQGADPLGGDQLPLGA